MRKVYAGPRLTLLGKLVDLTAFPGGYLLDQHGTVP